METVWQHGDDPAIDGNEAEALYNLLEQEIAPEFYARNERGIPVAWVRKLRESMARLTPRFSANRAVREYAEKHYLPSALAFEARRADSGEIGKQVVSWRHELDRKWAKLHFGAMKIQTDSGKHAFEIQVYLDNLDPTMVKVELYAEGISGGVPINQEMQVIVRPVDDVSGAHIYAGAARRRSPERGLYSEGNATLRRRFRPVGKCANTVAAIRKFAGILKGGLRIDKQDWKNKTRLLPEFTQIMEVIKMRKSNSFASLVFIVILGIGVGSAFVMYKNTASKDSIWIGIIALVLAILVSVAIKVADQWEKAVILRLGKFRSLKGPGLFFIIPVIDAIPYWIDTRIITTTFKAEKTLTKDTVPVDVDAVLFWKVLDPQKAALAVAEFKSAISWASQTALRDVIGKTILSDMLEGREKISKELQRIIDERTEPWGINVISVEVKDVLIPPALEDAMSMQAQAERERQARVILGDSERQVAEKFGEAAKTYINNPVALHLRAMNMLYEGLKENATIVVVPSSVLETMQLGGIAGVTALTMGIGQENANKAKEKELKKQE